MQYESPSRVAVDLCPVNRLGWAMSDRLDEAEVDGLVVYGDEGDETIGRKGWFYNTEFGTFFEVKESQLAREVNSVHRSQIHEYEILLKNDSSGLDVEGRHGELDRYTGPECRLQITFKPPYEQQHAETREFVYSDDTSVLSVHANDRVFEASDWQALRLKKLFQHDNLKTLDPSTQQLDY